MSSKEKLSYLKGQRGVPSGGAEWRLCLRPQAEDAAAAQLAGEACWGPGGHREAREGRGILLQATVGTLDAVLRWGPSGAFKQRRDRMWLLV